MKRKNPKKMNYLKQSIILQWNNMTTCHKRKANVCNYSKLKNSNFYKMLHRQFILY